MAIAINVRAHGNSGREVEQLWDQVAAFEDEPSMRTLGYRPHFTFAIYDSPAIAEETAWQAMLRAAAGEMQLRIEFRRVRWFAGPPLVLWLEPVDDAALRRWHAAVCAAIDPAYCRPHYRPGRWTPHCTLGTRITEERHHEAIDFAGSFNRSMTVLFDVADCVVFPPVRVVAEQKLPAGAR
ncbi:2'-5' RNA ligase family protein [Bradyrhizobium manausense]|uniref:Calmodulin n=1 Tax=Bradyrhizobium manausense TaxID=989370 RepID=A0A0R3D1E9_9BRAD|nr:2'-5' RNA ligase family protein [Bradyrhizobium manausense]KRQ03546.1 calmodulin [Bradyrhizobium manausense]